jgi:hypothetical protein
MPPMPESALDAIRDIIQEDVGGRGLRADPRDNLITATSKDFSAACQSMAAAGELAVGIVTGFLIPTAVPPAPETDGPLGTVFLAHCLIRLGARVVIACEANCMKAIEVGLEARRVAGQVNMVTLESAAESPGGEPDYLKTFRQNAGELTHLISVERVGPGHAAETIRSQAGANKDMVSRFLREVPEARRGRCYTAKGRDISAATSPAHWLFATGHSARAVASTTIGIGDGGNEIGMGRISWDTIRRNIPDGGLIACRVATDHLIVAGISNWGAYGLAAGVGLLRGASQLADWFDATEEHNVLRTMVESGGLVDGVTGKPTLSVDGLDFGRYSQCLERIRDALVSYPAGQR